MVVNAVCEPSLSEKKKSLFYMIRVGTGSNTLKLVEVERHCVLTSQPQHTRKPMFVLYISYFKKLAITIKYVLARPKETLKYCKANL